MRRFKILILILTAQRFKIGSKKSVPKKFETDINIEKYKNYIGNPLK